MNFLKTIRLKKEFDLLYQRGKSVNGKFFYLKYLPSRFVDKNFLKFGIIISTKISKKAVERNKKRRQLQEIIRLNADKLKGGFSILIIAKDSVLLADYNDIERDFLELIKKSKINV
uniref:Ribonuclease P protein component n=1 Tax=candidate division CPR3 bacterium TaxID=2268181 RepID=A0A7C4M081_UNCC3